MSRLSSTSYFSPQSLYTGRLLDKEFYDRFSRALEAAHVQALRHEALRRSHYDPNQPRVPPGHPDGGQWTRAGWGGSRLPFVQGSARAARASSGDVQSDAVPEPIRAWSQYAQAGGQRDTSDPAIEQTRLVLLDILARVNALAASHRDPVSARLYGVLVHAAFANAVRAQNLPGIGKIGVEQSFDPNGLARYGLDGSIRTDIVLRNAAGDIIAIYDVKTGNATMAPAREARIRAYTKIGRGVPVIILRAIRGAGQK